MFDISGKSYRNVLAPETNGNLTKSQCKNLEEYFRKAFEFRFSVMKVVKQNLDLYKSVFFLYEQTCKDSISGYNTLNPPHLRFENFWKLEWALSLNPGFRKIFFGFYQSSLQIINILHIKFGFFIVPKLSIFNYVKIIKIPPYISY